MNGTNHITTPAGPATKSLYRLIADYWDRYDRLVTAMHASDATVQGSPEREIADELQHEASEVLDDAACAILEYRPTRTIESRIKANFAEGLADRNAGLTSDELGALLSSLPYLMTREAVAA